MILFLFTFDCGWLNLLRGITAEATVEKNMLVIGDPTETECPDQLVLQWRSQ